MGFAASTARLLMLVARKTDLEFQLQLIQQARMRLANVMDRLFLTLGNLDPNSPQIRQLEILQERIKNQDKRLEVIANRITTQHQAVETEIQAVRKVISKNIASSFGLMGDA
ncbi:MAG: hypothetical protein SFZ03_01540 [Candidatus Melainabacteria bacterium]|nr:hypothetical protein [Candidatus Melainabacteria bacterium]